MNRRRSIANIEPTIPSGRSHPRRKAVTTTEYRVTLRELALVSGGGALGSMARYAIGLTVPDAAGLPTATFVVNVIGAFALGMLVQALSISVPSASPRHGLRLLWGTGFLGGFTTYSGFATGVVILSRNGRSAAALVYALTTVLMGIGAASGGVMAGSRLGHRLGNRTEVDPE